MNNLVFAEEILICMQNERSQSKSDLLWNWRSVTQSVSHSVCLGIEPLWDSWQDFGYSQGSCGFVCHGASSLSRGRVCHI